MWALIGVFCPNVSDSAFNRLHFPGLVSMGQSLCLWSMVASSFDNRA